MIRLNNLLPLVMLFVSATPLLSADEPNVVIIYADDMGYGDLAVNGSSKKIPTPNLDRLARSGLRFTDGHSSSGICTPSRFALLTGQHHWRRFHGIVGSFGESVFTPDDFTLGKMFKSRGYNTAAIGKWHLGWNWDAIKMPDVPMVKVPEQNWKAFTPKAFDWSKPVPGGPLAQGFDYYFGDGTINFPPYCFMENDRVLEAPTVMMDTQLFKDIPEGRWEFRHGPMVQGWDPYKVLPTSTDRAVEWIEKQSDETPFFMYFALPSPHAPIIPNDAYRGKSEAGPYGDFVCESDAMAGRVLDALKRKGLSDNTIVIFTADNGAEKYANARQETYGHWSSGPFRGVKRDTYEGGHHVPFLISWPAVIKPGSVTDEVVSQVDFAATFAAIIGYDLNSKEAQDSYDLLPLLKGESHNKPLRKATVQNTFDNGYALRQGDWVYVNQGFAGKLGWIPGGLKPTKVKAPGLLYNLKDDPGQHDNLYNKFPERVADMNALLERYLSGVPCAPHARKQGK